MAVVVVKERGERVTTANEDEDMFNGGKYV